jgi:PAS domain S-box-containing protein
MALAELGMGAAVLEASLDAIVITDAEGHVLEFNPAAERLFGYARAETLGRRIGDLIVPAHHREAHETGMARYAAGNPARVVGKRLELEARHADGRIFPVELAIVEAGAGDRRYFAASLRDLSERRAREAELHAQREFLRALIDDQNEMVIRSDADYRILFCNQAASRFFGLPREALIGKFFTPGTPDEVKARLIAELPHLTPEAPVRRSVDPKLMPDGSTRWLDWSNRSIFDPEGRLVGHISVARDITEAREKAEVIERVNRQNALYRRMFEAMPDAVYAKDLEGRFTAANRAMAESLGAADAEALIGRRKTDFLPAEIARGLAEAERDFLNSGEEGQIRTLPVWNPDGTEGWQVTRNALFRDDAGQVIGLIGHSRDVTDQVRAEQALAQSEARFAAFVENAPVAMFLKDSEGRYVVLNAQACAVIGKPRDQIIGRTAREVGTLRSAEQTEAADRAVIAERVPLSSVVQLTEAGQPYHWAMILRFPVAAPDGKGLWIGGFAIDITAQRAAEADLERSREALHQSEKLNAMGSLLAGVAHELNNPLAIVVAQATLMEEDARGGPLARRAEKIRTAGERCGRIVKTFLGLARRQPTEIRRAGLNEMVQAATELMAYSLRTAGMVVELDLDPAGPQVEGDADLLAQVVLNLLVNAQQALDGATGPRRIRLATSSQPGQSVLEVSDSGPGVPEAIRARIFEPFFSTKPQGLGTGVGLSFCHNVVSAHQGRLELMAPGQGLAGALEGAVFRVTLPAAAPASGAETPNPAPEAPPAPALRALVVDDEPELAEVLAEILSSAGYAAEIAVTVAEAQARIAAAPFELIFSDLRMPDADGRAFHAWLSAHHPDQAARLAFVTGDALGVVASGFLTGTGRPVLEKPFTRDGVLRVAAEARGLTAKD